MRLKTVGVVALALMMILSFAPLVSADEPSSPAELTSTTIAQGTDTGFSVADPGDDYATKLVAFVLFWGFGDQETGWCPSEAPAVDDPGALGTECLDVSGPNGQVNHGTFVSAFVHWLKTEDGMSLLDSYDGPRGRLVSQAAKSGFGKGPKIDEEPPMVETDDGVPKGWSNPHNPHSHP
jgi:hypothetical protein